MQLAKNLDTITDCSSSKFWNCPGGNVSHAFPMNLPGSLDRNQNLIKKLIFKDVNLQSTLG
jgi:hypothetical protein